MIPLFIFAVKCTEKSQNELIVHVLGRLKNNKTREQYCLCLFHEWREVEGLFLVELAPVHLRGMLIFLLTFLFSGTS